MHKLADIYKSNKNFKFALEWYEKAAQLNYSPCIYELIFIHEIYF